MTGKSLKGKTYEDIYGNKKAKELKKIRKENWTGRKHSTKSIEKMKKIKLGKKFTTNHRQNLSLNHRKYQTTEARKKTRISMINYIKKTRGNFSPNIGKNEKQILDKIAKEIGYKIIRQYFIDGYFVDGYCKEKNIVFEIDEKHHFDLDRNLKKKDKIREQEIKQKLNCEVIRICDTF